MGVANFKYEYTSRLRIKTINKEAKQIIRNMWTLCT